MSQRTVAVVLSAQVSNYLANMSAAERRTLEVEQALKNANQRFEAHNRALDAAGKGMLVAGAAAAVAFGVVVKASADYGAKMAQLQSLSKASQGDMQRMSAAAMTQGTAFGQSASQVADAEIELTKAGRDASQILGGDLKGALALAAAGQMDVAQATQIGVTAVTQFAKSGATIPHVADLLAAGADKALGSVDQLGQALNQGGLVASQMGLNVDQTVGTLSAFAQAGLLGSDAGTSFKTMLLALQSPSQQAQKYLKEYNLTAYDSKGAFVGIVNLSEQLQKAFKGKSDAERDAAMSTIFGTDAIRTANVLYEQGGKGIQGWIDKVNVSGFASAQAAGKMNSLQGDTQKLAAAFQTDLVKAGTSADGALRGVVQSATGVVKAVGDIPAPLQTGLLAATALTAGVGLLGGAFLIGVPKIAAFRAGLADLNLTGRQAAGVFGKGTAIVVGLSAIAAGMAAAGEMGVASSQQIALAGEKAKAGWKDVDKLFGSAGSSLFAGSGLKKSLDELGNGSDWGGSASGTAKQFDGMVAGLTHLSDVYKANEGTFDAMGQQLAGIAKQNYGAASSSFASLVSKYHLTGDEVKNLLRVMPAYRDELVAQAEKAGISASTQNLVNLAQGKGAGAARLLTAAYTDAQIAAAQQAAAVQGLSGSAVNAATDISSLEKTIEGFGSAQLDARSATRAMYQAIDDATAAAAKNGRTLDVHTQKGRDNQAALDGIASAADTAASKTLEQTGSAQKAAAVMQHGRDAFVKAATAMTGSAKEANNLADKLGLIPSNITVAVKADGFDEAANRLKNLQTKLAGLQSKKISVEVATQIDVANSQIRVAVMQASGVDYFGNPVRRAAGGQIDGRGPKGVDSVPAILAPNEHVWTSSEVDAAGGHGAVYRIRAAAAAGELRGFASGGAVGDAHRGIDRYRSEVAAAKSALRRASKARKDAAQQRLTAAEDRLKTANDRLTSLQQGREDFVSGQRRDYGQTVDPLTYVDQLRSMSRDTADFGPTRRAAFYKTANAYEASLVKLTAASAAATEKLDGLKQSSAQLHDSIAQAITGGYQASAVPLTGARDASTRTVASGWITRNGIRMRNYSTVDVAAAPGHITAGGIAAYYTQGGHDATQFAANLRRLAQRGVNPTLLSEIAGYGVAQGAPIAAALLSGSASQIAQVNAGYASIASAAGAAGTTVADANYAKQIAAAEANADKITKQIASDGEKLRSLIARAFGLHGYAAGTTSATPGIHLVGEHGPELVGFAGGEWVKNAHDTAGWVRGGGAGGRGGTMQVAVTMPASMNLVDADGTVIGRVRTEARDVATQVVTAKHDQIAVRLMGAAV